MVHFVECCVFSRPHKGRVLHMGKMFTASHRGSTGLGSVQKNDGVSLRILELLELKHGRLYVMRATIPPLENAPGRLNRLRTRSVQ